MRSLPGDDCRGGMSSRDWNDAMDRALAEAQLAVAHGDVPVGAVLVDADGAVVAADHNRREDRSDPTAHAEVLVLQAAASERGDWRLDGQTVQAGHPESPPVSAAR